MLARKSLSPNILLVLFSLAAAPVLGAPPERSTSYDGASYYSYADHPAFKPEEEITVEAWVYREDASRCETIVSKNFLSSWWLGFCPQLRFYTGGGSFSDADRTVAANQWCHVAVTVNQNGQVSFYIDGNPAGGGPLAPVAHNTGSLTIGANVDGGFAFLGSIDELRIWDRARTSTQVRQDLHLEVRGAPGLQAAFPTAGGSEVVAGLTGTANGAPLASVFGMLPSELRVPWASGAMSFDGAIGSGEYDGGEHRPLRYHRVGPVRYGRVRVVQDEQHLFVAVEQTTANSSPQVSPCFTLLVAGNRDGSSDLTADENAVLILSGDGSISRSRGDSTVGWIDCAQTGDCPAPDLSDVRSDVACASTEFGPCVEFRISKTLLGSDPTKFGLALWHFGLADPDGEIVSGLLPDEADDNDPATWAYVELEPRPEPEPTGAGTCEDPFLLPSEVPTSRVENLNQAGNSVERASCLPLPTPGPDAFYVYKAPFSGRYRVVARSVSEGTPNLALAMSDCPVTPAGCVVGADRHGDGGPEVLLVDLVAEEEYGFLVDSSRVEWRRSTRGPASAASIRLRTISAPASTTTADS